MFLVGLDIVDDKLMEINVFTPGGLGSAQAATGVDFAEVVIRDLERKVEVQKLLRREHYATCRSRRSNFSDTRSTVHRRGPFRAPRNLTARDIAGRNRRPTWLSDAPYRSFDEPDELRPQVAFRGATPDSDSLCGAVAFVANFGMTVA